VRAGEGWLRANVPAAPAALLEAMVEALPERAASDADALAEGALALYGAVARGSGGREDALPLLAADALLTHAFHAQAESGPSGLSELAARVGARGRLPEVLP